MNAVMQKRLVDDHRRLDEEIDRMLQRRWADPYKIQQLKKQKLAIKDRLHCLASDDQMATEAA